MLLVYIASLISLTRSRVSIFSPVSHGRTESIVLASFQIFYSVARAASLHAISQTRLAMYGYTAEHLDNYVWHGFDDPVIK